MSDDWNKVTILRKPKSLQTNPNSHAVVNKARRQGLEVVTSQKFGAATNKAATHNPVQRASWLDQETEELKHDKITADIGKMIAQARQSKKMSQKELAAKICEKVNVINELEAGRSIQNNALLAKVERALDIKLRGKSRGKPLKPPAANAKK